MKEFTEKNNERIRGYFAMIVQDCIELEKIYSCIFPDLPGCFSSGRTVAEAISNATNALSQFYVRNKGNIPEPKWNGEIENQNGEELSQMIILDTKRLLDIPYKTVRRSVTVPKYLDDLGKKYEVNFSEIFTSALKEELKSRTRMEDAVYLEN